MNAQRESSLRFLGFRGYGEYLASRIWADIRTRVIERAGGRCRCCGERATQVHHRSYDIDTMRGARPGNLVALCRRCHEAAEFDRGEKVELSAANGRVDQFKNPARFLPDPPAAPTPNERQLRAVREKQRQLDLVAAEKRRGVPEFGPPPLTPFDSRRPASTARTNVRRRPGG